MDVQATFDFSPFPSPSLKLYNCRIASQDFANVKAVAAVRGAHISAKHTDDDVRALTLASCRNMPAIPRGIPGQFSAVVRLVVTRCGLKEISRNDLSGFHRLQVLCADFNDLERLPGDLFSDQREIEDVSFYNNKIKSVDDDFFDDFPRTIGKFDLRGNSAGLDEIFEAAKGQTVEEFRSRVSVAKYRGGLMRDVLAFLHNNDFRDFVVTIGDVEFDVHRFLLEARSPVLGDMIRNNPDVQSLNLDNDVSVATFRVILNFLYHDQMPSDDDDADMLELFEVATKFEIESLRNFATEKVVKTVSARNASEIFIVGEKFQSEELKMAAAAAVKEECRLDATVAVEKVEEILHEKRKFDEEIGRDLREIEELRKRVELKRDKKRQWLNSQLHSEKSAVAMMMELDENSGKL